MYKNILVPLDGSKLAEQVLPHVGELARAFEPRVILVNGDQGRPGVQPVYA